MPRVALRCVILSMLVMASCGACMVPAHAAEAPQKGEWSGFVERTGHSVPRLIAGEITYRLQAAEGAPLAVKDTLDKIGAGTLKGYFVVTGATETDASGRPWIFVDSIAVSTPPPGVQPKTRVPVGPPPDDGMEQWWAERDVPHGQLQYLAYPSKVLGGVRRAAVYLPPGYDDAPGERYPVLYLMNGESWVVTGKANLILDNLLAEKRIVPMIAVMVTGPERQYTNAQFIPKPTGAAAAAAETTEDWINKCGVQMLQEVIPAIEAKFRVQGDAAHRALAGLSAGGCQTLATALGHIDQFQWIGPFSYGPRLQFDTVFPQFAAGPKPAASDVRLVFVACGNADPLLPVSSELADWLKAKGLPYQFHEYGGGHEWGVWQRCLVDFTVQLFRERQE